MINLVYSSRAFRTLSHDDLFLLLSQSRKNNLLNNITGVLLYNHNRFIQLIEGEIDIVMELYSKIKNDIRHNEIKLELSNDVVERNFPDWSMGFFDADESEKYNIAGFSRFLETGFEIGPVHNDNNNALNLLLDFKRLANLQNCA